MPRLDSALLDIGGFDLLAAQDTPVHRRDPRAKVVTALAFIVTVVSFGKYEVAALTPLLLYPVALISLGRLPTRYLLGKVLLASPFALLVGALNPVLDTTHMLSIGPVAVSGGWVSYAGILLRFVLTLLAALILVATTGFHPVCVALERLRIPAALVTQLMLLYRYFFVLAREASNMSRAWSLRAVQPAKMPVRVFVSLAGQLLIRALDRAQRIHMAMLSRGFDGIIRLPRPLAFRSADAAFVLGWALFFGVVRWCDLPRAIGHVLTGFAQ